MHFSKIFRKIRTLLSAHIEDFLLARNARKNERNSVKVVSHEKSWLDKKQS